MPSICEVAPFHCCRTAGRLRNCSADAGSIETTPASSPFGGLVLRRARLSNRTCPGGFQISNFRSQNSEAEGIPIKEVIHDVPRRRPLRKHVSSGTSVWCDSKGDGCGECPLANAYNFMYAFVRGG
jgi:hypothetical protein